MYGIINLIMSVSASFVAIFAIFLLHKGKKNISNRILALFFIAQFLLYINYILIYYTWDNPRVCSYVCYMSFPVCFLWGPLIYYYIKSQTVKNLSFNPYEIVHLIPFISALLYIIVRFYSKDIDTRVLLITQHSLDSENIIFFRIMSILLFIYNLSSVKLFLDFKKRIENYYSSYDNYKLTWLKYFLYGYMAACFVPATFHFSGDFIVKSYVTKQIVIMLAFLLLFSFLFYQAIIRPYNFIVPVDKEKNSFKTFNYRELDANVIKIQELMLSQKPYLNQSLTLKELSDASGINERILSQVIKKHWGQNFYSFINSYRIEEAKAILCSQKTERLSMLGVAFESGFNSKTVFYDTFKKYTGMTPSDYRKKTFQDIILVGVNS